jgi:DNA mismatch repair ATPase MutL
MSATLGRLFFRVSRPMAIRSALQATIRSNVLARLPLTANRSKTTKAAEKVATPKSTPKSTTAGKATTTKATTKATTTRKAAAAKTKKPAAAASKKKSAVTAKAKPKKVVKLLSAEQKEAKLQKRQKEKALETRKLKKEQALKPPFRTMGQISGYNVYVSEWTSARQGQGPHLITSELASEWKALPEAQKAVRLLKQQQWVIIYADAK